MKKTVLFLFLFAFGFTQGQTNLLAEDFDDLAAIGDWSYVNVSNPIGTSNWSQGDDGTNAPFGFNTGSGFIAANYNNTAGTGTISNWLFSPVVGLQDGDVISFYTRVPDGSIWADRLELRISQGGTFVEPADENDVSSFTTLLLTVNPNLVASEYPQTWTQYTGTVSGVGSASMDCVIAFRYYVTNGGPSGANSNYIGIDTFSVDRPLSTNSFFSNNFLVYPNPASDVVNISVKNNVTVSQTELTDINGRVVKSANGFTSQINISELNAGVYFLKITTDQGVGSSKIVKN